mmetsp:Transcript_3165/g.5003  ORF Transcript_3165/g.5003 Transcript_3165/m.5003 type:complete len:88 (+) Transcript_3165:1153-1416(+)
MAESSWGGGGDDGARSFESHAKFYSQLLMFFKRINSLANLATSGVMMKIKTIITIISLSTTINDDRAGKSPSLLHSIAKAMEDTTSM